ncbi:MAG: PDZ domain-containing protein [Flavisolibacter sp.]|nr:PDZ domain-containing protein [Flavisolibacter sp.]
MKQVFMKRLLIAGIALLTVPSVFAQKEKEDKAKAGKKDVQTIIITRTGDKNEKVFVEVDGDKVKVNGKDAKDNKDVSVRVQSMSTPNIYFRGGDNVTSAQGFSIFNEDENRAMLGVTTEGDDKGAEILSVTKESAAEKAGLKKGDIITKIGDRKIESSDDVTDAIRKHKPGDKVSITYLRDGKSQTATAELTKWKGVRMGTMTIPRIDILGGEMGDLDQRFNRRLPSETFSLAFGRPRLGLSIQDTDDGVGVKVLDVDEESAAEKAGIKKDDIIIGVDDTDVKGTEDVLRATRGNQDKTSYKFKVKRDNSTQTIEVKIPRKLKTADL